ncbi:hypothetical protein AO938_32770 [Pseudomonas aeruginosa]|nr:hypothetical protein AO891_31580 [Pseudomonas aeruginosa]OPD73960.1 hypothetical protein AO907_36585 [Pseudomonas aeruginosa]OPD81022.1 hypothetical protein AO938_32770 [Pseudomonas aeruginosa]OPD87359.1 hypothetical protein AO954_35405 [Pseudomonas aeruginosa]OPD89386.1 hypothetical protein AO966_33100 [Pseudomonas aeruginosa]
MGFSVGNYWPGSINDGHPALFISKRTDGNPQPLGDNAPRFCQTRPSSLPSPPEVQYRLCGSTVFSTCRPGNWWQLPWC